MGLLGFVGRVAFAFIFISSGLQKLQSFEAATGGPLVSSVVAPSLEKAYNSVSEAAGQPLPVKFKDIEVRSHPRLHILAQCLIRAVAEFKSF